MLGFCGRVDPWCFLLANHSALRAVHVASSWYPALLGFYILVGRLPRKKKGFLMLSLSFPWISNISRAMCLWRFILQPFFTNAYLCEFGWLNACDTWGSHAANIPAYKCSATAKAIEMTSKTWDLSHSPSVGLYPSRFDNFSPVCSHNSPE